MNYIELINTFWSVNLEYSFTGNEAKLYYYLVHVSNTLAWKNPFRHSDSQISIGAGMSVNSIKSARNRLKQAGLIDFKKGKQGNQNVITNKGMYQLLSGVSKNDSPLVPPLVGPEETPPPIEEPKTPPPPKKPKVKKEIDISFVDVVYLSIVKDFMNYRRSDIKKPFKTERGVKQFYNELLKLSGNNLAKAKELAEHAKGKEWQTVYAIKSSQVRKPFKNESVKQYSNQL